MGVISTVQSNDSDAFSLPPYRQYQIRFHSIREGGGEEGGGEGERGREREGDRKSVGEGKSVDLGGRRIIKKKNNHNHITLTFSSANRFHAT